MGFQFADLPYWEFSRAQHGPPPRSPTKSVWSLPALLAVGWRDQVDRSIATAQEPRTSPTWIPQVNLESRGDIKLNDEAPPGTSESSRESDARSSVPGGVT
jgi:hypothetical protein